MTMRRSVRTRILSLPCLVAVVATTAGAFAPLPHPWRPSAGVVVVSPLFMSTLAPTSPHLREATPPEDDDDVDDQQQQQLPQRNDEHRLTRRDPERNVLASEESAPTVVTRTTPRGAISSTLAELSEMLGGRGRAQLAWDCYSIGVDPALFYSPIIQLGHDDFETIMEQLPSQRRRQRLGADTLRLLASTYHHSGGGGEGAVATLEGGVASLSHVSVAADSTTKLLLKLRDGLEVETVIIPWKGVRSTLCISSQVGCRQGACVTGEYGRPFATSRLAHTKGQLLLLLSLLRFVNRVHLLRDRPDGQATVSHQ